TYDYMITLSNSGPNAADNATFTDTLPAGISFVSITQNTGPSAFCNTGSTVTCSVPTLLNGESASFTLTVQPSSTIANGTVVTNTATASSSTSDTNPNNNSSSSMTTISANADLSIVKSGPATVNAGNNVTYTITVMDNGPSTASSVSWTDTLPFGETFVSENQTTGPPFNCTTGAAITCSIASLNPGDTATFTVVAQVSPATVNGTQLNNTANVSSTTPDGTPGNNTSIATTTVSSVADVSVVKSAPAAATAGSNVTYTITVMNNGPSNASSVTLTDTLPPGTTFVSENQTSGPAFNCTTGATITCSIATLNAGDTAIFSVTVNFNGSLANGTTVTNTATVTSTTADSNPANNTSSAPTLVSANADLSVTKSGPATTPSNTTVVYTVTAANGGSSTATNVTLTETVPAGMTFVSVNQTTGPAFSCNGSGPVVCTIASFNSGASATFQFTFNVPLSTPAGTQTTNTVTISSQTPDNNPANNTASVTTTVGASIPALSPLAMALLALMLAMIGWMTARR
ncbi:MAG TPA: DUF11 domain-containing protein, partial [Thermoanaerobaculia bacterium]|nr:DUF11 domain-containing protein [Thermoanaerobaculia bacterium]